ncbi:GNAT family N-acetyltransferase [Erythrobacter litoralis]|uniref:GNAT family N-acetyltransferase n=1 Tax=Erythrobacter litoralis TaxID=39960 RepID=UPI00243606F9|nr:GNAT family N-acetyltransferase [Erythrobacter litoralis]MDG6078719.1 GNAT family N-acetyltransferase [Erythrobacter litoralis]
MGVEIRRLQGSELRAQLDALAFLRIAVFEDYPYLYAGDIEYERDYLAQFANAPGSVLVAAYAHDRLVGAATCCPLKEYRPNLGDLFEKRGYDLSSLFYFGESVLLRECRGQGIGHRFFDEREKAGREAGATQATFCAVVREDDHPLRPDDYRPLDGFWQRRGYTPIDDLTMTLEWDEHGGDETADHTMQFWIGAL